MVGKFPQGRGSPHSPALDYCQCYFTYLVEISHVFPGPEPDPQVSFTVQRISVWHFCEHCVIAIISTLVIPSNLDNFSMCQFILFTQRLSLALKSKVNRWDIQLIFFFFLAFCLYQLVEVALFYKQMEVYTRRWVEPSMHPVQCVRALREWLWSLKMPHSRYLPPFLKYIPHPLDGVSQP